MAGVTILDGPVGTELAARGVATPAPLWSANAVEDAAPTLSAIHADYARAGATVHTAATFRTTPRAAGGRWGALLERAVVIARGAVPAGHRVAGSVAPVEDCYRPDLSPPDARASHRAVTRALAAAGVDLILCETFAHVGEALVAIEEATATGLPVWAAFTAGPDADLLTADEIDRAAREAVRRGASAVLVNCVAATKTLPFVERLGGAGVPFGAYANAGASIDRIGWTERGEGAAARYVDEAKRWVLAGATLVGGCCGTGPEHIRAIARAFG